MIIRWLFNKSIQMIKIKEVTKLNKEKKNNDDIKQMTKMIDLNDNKNKKKTNVILTKSVFILLALKNVSSHNEIPLLWPTATIQALIRSIP